LGLLREACNLLRTADSDTTDPRILDRINQTLNKGIRLGYGTSVGIEHMPSFAHSDEDGHPALEGPHREDGIFCALDMVYDLIPLWLISMGV
jgi:hypothetical protein